MSDPSSKPKIKKPNVDSDDIARFLERTGFVFEMRANEVFRKAGYATEISDEFLDLEGDTIREIDLVATKVINDINVHFVIECKQSVTDKWIFICNKNMPRYYRAVKHLPSVNAAVFKGKGLFADFHVSDHKIPVGHNYLCYTIERDKKAEHHQIVECIHKLPKALVDLASRVEGGRHLFFPVALFTGQIFAASYHGKLLVREVPLLQYYEAFEPAIYRQEPEAAPSVLGTIWPALSNLERWAQQDRRAKIRRAAKELGFAYQLDFVTEAGLSDYLALIEKQVAGVRVADWLLLDPPASVSVPSASD